MKPLPDDDDDDDDGKDGGLMKMKQRHDGPLHL